MDDLINKLIKVGSIKFGEFTLSSGKKSNVYIDIKLAATNPEILETIANAIVEKLRSVEFDKIACIELGGVPLAIAVSLKLKKPVLIFRKEKKVYGLGEDLIGDLKNGDRVVIIEDVVTTGKSAISIMERVRQKGGIIVGLVAVVDREESNLKFESLLKLSDLIKAKNFLNSTKI
ncbi:MAG: orotate phosphoribosyltransferase [Archaeoglobaceae archaeon]|nr:orotate phosphoribosyltransferase [Archaeoglobaceae archaeon]MDW7990052.1 orotate phosphoribosyltransferase [Archaeoglobaceae archaeon]